MPPSPRVTIPVDSEVELIGYPLKHGRFLSPASALCTGACSDAAGEDAGASDNATVAGGHGSGVDRAVAVEAPSPYFLRCCLLPRHRCRLTLRQILTPSSHSRSTIAADVLVPGVAADVLVPGVGRVTKSTVLYIPLYPRFY